ncbi:MAG: hypothetical protein N2Z22_06045 [Turneriella sp.]|nr:hypothetical protein [Leptospiraceae bacterium]MCX7632874.1 hypothetical protein [Turneriella sp.]
MSTGEIRSSNILRIGSSTLDELEEKVKALRTINLNVKKRRYIVAREDIKLPSGEVIIAKGSDIDISKVKLLRRYFKGDHIVKTFQPDEGIVLISDMSTPMGIQFSMDLVTQVMNIGGGAYEAFIDRVDSFKEFVNLYNKALFPKLAVVGYIPMQVERVKEELAFYHLIVRTDPYIRMLEILHKQIKPQPLIPRIRNLMIVPEDRDSWKRFILEIITEYTKPYSIEER